MPTDVIETGRFRAQLVAPAGQKKMRPGRPGCSVGFQFTAAKAGYVMAGTFGAVVAAGGVTYILSNNHVLADENALPIGSPIFQPGLLDHGNAATDQIAKLTRFITLPAGAGNAVDCAIAEALAKNVSATIALRRRLRVHALALEYRNPDGFRPRPPRPLTTGSGLPRVG